MTKKLKACFFLAAVVLISTMGAHAGIVGTDSPALISHGLAVDWTSVGVEYAYIQQPFSISLSDAIGATVSLPGSTADLMRVDEGTSWFGDFALGTPLLWTNWDPGPLRFVFDQPIQAFGLHIQPDFGGGPPPPPFTATMAVFGTGDILLGSVSLDGFSTLTEDGTAPFLGFFSSQRDVVRVDIGVIDEDGFPVDFAVDGPVGSASIPEPGGFWLAVPPLVAFLARHSWRSRPDHQRETRPKDASA